MELKLALVGNPNSGKTTLFNALTGSNQFVGNWPGVTVEKKEGKIKGGPDNAVLVDLPGIYSLSPYTLEEVVSRNFLIDEKPAAVINIIDGSNLERNLYLTTQLTELDIPVITAINMIDVVRKNGDKIDLEKLSEALGCEVIEISALKNEGTELLAQKAVELAKSGKRTMKRHRFSGSVEHAIAHIEEAVLHDMPETEQRWYSVKLFERDKNIIERLGVNSEKLAHIEKDITECEEELDDDSESIIANERYNYVTEITSICYTRKRADTDTVTDRIDRVVTNRWLALPIFAAVMFLIYYISMSTIGAAATDWTNDHLFGSGWHLLGIGAAEYSAGKTEFADAAGAVEAFLGKAENNGFDTKIIRRDLDGGAEDFSPDGAEAALGTLSALFSAGDTADYTVVNEETMSETSVTYTAENLSDAAKVYLKYGCSEPKPQNYGIWVPGIPVLAEKLLDAAGCADWLKSLTVDGIIGGVGSVLGFVPQMLVLFFMLAFVEGCGYMSRIAFIMDKVFRKFGLSGKSFIPILIGTGCGVPGIMASRTIESDQDRKMTVITTTFIPCGAKTPFIAMIAGAVFGGSPLIATSAYLMGIAAIIISGIILKKTRLFAGEPAPFVMELPAYHMPTLGNVLKNMWDRGWSFIKKAGTVILVASVLVWFTSSFGFIGGRFALLTDEQTDMSILAAAGKGVCVLFKPLGWGMWQAAVASITGLAAKENIVGTMGVLYGEGGGSLYENLAEVFNGPAAYSFLAFNLLCAPCFAAIGAIRREMNNMKWTLFAVGYQTAFAYAVSLCIYQAGMLACGSVGIGTIAAAAVAAGFVYMIFFARKAGEKTKKRHNSASV